MMVYPVWTRRARRFASLTILALLWSVAEARIGDTPEQMSSRLTQSGVGKTFFWPKDMAPREKERQLKENPIMAFNHLLPTAAEEWKEQIFWKSALHRQPSDENGWRIHVYHLKGRSVLELYRRVGQSLNEYEIAGLLGRMRGDQIWRRVPKKEGATKQEDSILGYDYQLGEEGAEVLRARKQGDWLIVYHKRFDDYLAARKTRWDETETQRKAELAAENEKTAPVSVDGF